MDEVYPCPACGKETNRRGEPFTDKSQTKAHIEGAHDEAHDDVASGDIEAAPRPTAADGGEEQGAEDESGSSSAGAGSSEDSEGGVTFLDEPPGDETDDASDDGLGAVAVLVGLVILFAAVRRNSGNQTATAGPGPQF